jgi:hypothetical protein
MDAFKRKRKGETEREREGGGERETQRKREGGRERVRGRWYLLPSSSQMTIRKCRMGELPMWINIGIEGRSKQGSTAFCCKQAVLCIHRSHVRPPINLALNVIPPRHHPLGPPSNPSISSNMDSKDIIWMTCTVVRVVQLTRCTAPWQRLQHRTCPGCMGPEHRTVI